MLPARKTFLSKALVFPPARGLGPAALLLLSLAGAPAAQAQGYTLTTLASFSGSNGLAPFAGLTLSGSTLYGTTAYGGGTSNDGTVFSVPVGGGAVTDLVSFNGSNGSQPLGNLTLGTNGTLYGTTASGGATGNGSFLSGDGTVFSLTPNGGGAPVPEASSVVSFGLLLVGGLGAAALRARKRSAAG